MRFVEKDFNADRPLVAIIIPVADAEDEIARSCVEHLEKTVKVPFRLIMVESKGDEFAFGRSINAGVQRAAGFDIVIGMDSDAFPRPNAVENMLAFVRKHPELGYIGSKVHLKGSYPRVAFRNFGLFGFLILIGLGERAPFYVIRRLRRGMWYTFGGRDIPKFQKGKMLGATSTFFGLRRDCWEEVKGFDEGYRIQWSDIDFCYRIMLSRWYISTCISAEVDHDCHTTQRHRNELREFSGLDHFKELWPKERIKQVLKAGKAGKFRIYDE